MKDIMHYSHLLSSDDEDGSDNSQLLKQIRQLETEKGKLKLKIKKLERQNFALQEGLADRIAQKIQEAISGMKCPRCFSTPSSSAPSSSPASASSPAPASVSDEREHHGPNRASVSTAEGQTYISSAILRQIQRAKDQNKMTCQLMTSIFSLEEMASSLVTGKRLRAADKERPVLDQEKVNYIIATVMEQFPSASPSEIRAKMGQKCKDVRAAQKKVAPPAEANDNVDDAEIM